MRGKRLIAFIAMAVVVAGVTTLAATMSWNRKLPVFTDAPMLISAVQSFSRDLIKRGQPLPPTVSLKELVSGGYVASNVLNAFEGVEVMLSLNASDAVPQSVLMWARFPDGSANALLGDGSVQQVSSGRLKVLLGQQSAVTGR